MVDVAQLVESRLVVPVVAGSSPVIHPMSTSDEPARRWWWPAATAIAATVANAVLVSIEMLLFGGTVGVLSSFTRVVLVAHPIAGVGCAVLFSVYALVRGGGSGGFVGYSERYLRGLVYGFFTSIAISVAAGIALGDGGTHTTSLVAAVLSLSVVTLQMPLACAVGALTWQLLSKRRGVATGVARPRRPIEDPE